MAYVLLGLGDATMSPAAPGVDVPNFRPCPPGTVMAETGRASSGNSTIVGHGCVPDPSNDFNWGDALVAFAPCAIGAAIGYSQTPEDPAHGALVGAAYGAGVSIAIVVAGLAFAYSVTGGV